MPGLMLFLLVNPCSQQTTRKVQSKLVRPVQTVFNLGIRTYMQEPSHLQHIFFCDFEHGPGRTGSEIWNVGYNAQIVLLQHQRQCTECLNINDDEPVSEQVQIIVSLPTATGLQTVL